MPKYLQIITQIIIGIVVFIIVPSVFYYFTKDGIGTIQLFSVLVLLISVLLMNKQVLIMKEQSYKTTMPRVDIWPDFSPVYTNEAGLHVKNLSKFPAWVWISVEVKDKDGRKIDGLVSNSFFTKKNAWPMPPGSEFLHPFDKQLRDMVKQNETVRLYINYYSTPTSKPEPQPYFSELIYRYDYKDNEDQKRNNKKVWLISGFGVERSTIIKYTEQQKDLQAH